MLQFVSIKLPDKQWKKLVLTAQGGTSQEPAQQQVHMQVSALARVTSARSPGCNIGICTAEGLKLTCRIPSPSFNQFHPLYCLRHPPCTCMVQDSKHASVSQGAEWLQLEQKQSSRKCPPKQVALNPAATPSARCTQLRHHYPHLHERACPAGQLVSNSQGLRAEGASPAGRQDGELLLE
jgi:hypothetical protein